MRVRRDESPGTGFTDTGREYSTCPSTLTFRPQGTGTLTRDLAEETELAAPEAEANASRVTIRYPCSGPHPALLGCPEPPYQTRASSLSLGLARAAQGRLG